jgi:spoIIIJ-associated protein
VRGWRQCKRLPVVGQGRIEKEPGMSQQEDMVAQDAGHDEETGSYVAVSPAANNGAADDGAADDAAADDGAAEEAVDLEEAGDGGAADDDADETERAPVADLELEGEIAADYIEGLLDVADMDGDIDMDVEGDRAVVSVVGATLDELVGRRGEVLEALQELTRLAVHQQTGNRTRMMLDVGGYRQRRRAELAEAGNDAAEEVRRTGQPKRLWPMNPFERKVVHDAVAAAGLRSESEGEEPDRRVVVLPVG